jgi:serine/threonine-protein kinase RsbW
MGENVQGEIVLYGLKSHKEAIEFVIKKVGYEEKAFELKLILTEALSNAFKHGNKSDALKPIYLRYWKNDDGIKLEIQDSGNSNAGIKLLENMTEAKDIMDESGRGLFLIRCFVDNIEFENNVLRLRINKENNRKEVHASYENENKD